MKKLATLLIIAVAFAVIGCQPPGNVVTSDQLDAVKTELSALKTDFDGLKATVDSLMMKMETMGGKGTGMKPPSGGGLKPPTQK